MHKSLLMDKKDKIEILIVVIAFTIVSILMIVEALMYNKSVGKLYFLMLIFGIASLIFGVVKIIKVIKQ